MKKESAFPVSKENHPNSGFGHQGMTLRDYFAAKVLQSQLLDSGTEHWHNSTRAENAYELADAMLEARNK